MEKFLNAVNKQMILLTNGVLKAASENDIDPDEAMAVAAKIFSTLTAIGTFKTFNTNETE
jgi:hypothetical protein